MTEAKMRLRGDRNQCQGCGLYFNSTFAFDKHRVGKHGHDRRCLSETELATLGAVKGKDGFWRSVSKPREAFARHLVGS